VSVYTLPSPRHLSFSIPPSTSTPVHPVLYAFSPVGRRCQVVCSQPAKLSLTYRLQVRSIIAFVNYLLTNIDEQLAYRILNNRGC